MPQEAPRPPEDETFEEALERLRQQQRPPDDESFAEALQRLQGETTAPPPPTTPQPQVVEPATPVPDPDEPARDIATDVTAVTDTPPREVDEDSILDTFARGFRSGVAGQYRTTAGEVLQAFGAQTIGQQLERRGEEVFEEDPPPDFDEAPVDFFVHGTGQAFASMAPTVAGSAAGAAGGALIGSAFGGVGAIPGAIIGSRIGAFGPAYAMAFAEIRDELQSEGMTDSQASRFAVLGAVPIAALDAILPGKVAGKLLRMVVPGAIRRAGAKFAKNLAVQMARGGLIEGVTEGAQKVIEDLEISGLTERDFDFAETFKQATLEGAVAVLPGAALGGFGGVNIGQAPRDHKVPAPPQPNLEQELKHQAAKERARENPEPEVPLGPSRAFAQPLVQLRTPERRARGEPESVETAREALMLEHERQVDLAGNDPERLELAAQFLEQNLRKLEALELAPGTDQPGRAEGQRVAAAIRQEQRGLPLGADPRLQRLAVIDRQIDQVRRDRPELFAEIEEQTQAGEVSPIVLLGEFTGKQEQNLQDRGWGRMWIARGRKIKTYEGEPWALDNGAFRDFREGRELDIDAYSARVEEAMSRDNKPFMVVLPDEVGQADLTYNVTLDYMENGPFADRTDIPWYYVLQDGVTEAQVEDVISSGKVRGLFLGGTDRFKAEAGKWADFARRNDINFHYARAGTPGKVRHALSVRATSIDSALPLMSPQHMSKFVAALEGGVTSLPMFEGEPEAGQRIFEEPVTPPVAGGFTGIPTRVKNADASEFNVRYAVVDADEVQTSHNPQTFQPNPKYPDDIQERQYHKEPESQQIVVRETQRLDPGRMNQLVLEPVVGPPILREDLVALGGNQRSMMIKRAYEGVPERAAAYEADVRKVAAGLGIPIDPDISRPMLVRVMVGDDIDLTNREALAEIVSRFNDDPQKTRSPVVAAATAARRLQADGKALAHFAATIGDEQTTRKYLETGEGREFIKMLVTNGVIPYNEQANYRDADTGAATAEGKTYIEGMLKLAALEDPEVVARAPDGPMFKMEYAFPQIARVSQFEGFELGTHLAVALDLVNAARASASQTVAAYVQQLDAFAAPQFSDPIVQRLAIFLEQTKKLDVTRAFREYARAAAEESGQAAQVGLALAGGEPQTRRQLVEQIFPVDAKQIVAGAELETLAALERPPTVEPTAAQPTTTPPPRQRGAAPPPRQPPPPRAPPGGKPPGPPPPEGIPLDPADFLNTVRLGFNLPPGARDVLLTEIERVVREGRIPAVETPTREGPVLRKPVKSFADMRAEAARIGLDPDIVEQVAAREQLSDAQVIMIMDAITGNTDRMAEIDSTEWGGVAELERTRLEAEYKDREELHNFLLPKFSMSGTESARALVARRHYGLRSLHPAAWLNQVQRILQAQVAPGETAVMTEEIRKDTTRLVNKARKARAKAQKKAEGVTTADAATLVADRFAGGELLQQENIFGKANPVFRVQKFIRRLEGEPTLDQAAQTTLDLGDLTLVTKQYEGFEQFDRWARRLQTEPMTQQEQLALLFQMRETGVDAILARAGGKVPSGSGQGFLDREEQLAFIELQAFMERLTPDATLSERMTLFRKAMLLTSPVSHARNGLGNTIFLLMRQVTDPVGAMADFVIQGVTESGVRTKVGIGRDLRRVARMAANGAVRDMGDAMRGITPRSVKLKFDFFSGVEIKHPGLRKLTNAILRTYDAADRPFKRFAFFRALEEQAILLAREEGLTGAEAEARVEDIMGRPPSEMYSRAWSAAEYATFQDTSQLAALAHSLKTLRSVHGLKIPGQLRAALDFVVPFSRTPANIAARLIEHSPLSFAALGSDLNAFNKQLAKLADAREKGDANNIRIAERLVADAQLKLVNRISRGAVGTAAIAVGYVLAKADLLTGSPPKDERERAEWELEGRAPNALWFGGDWWQLSGLAPAANLLLVGANMHRFASDAELSKLDKGLLFPLVIAQDIAVNVKEQSFMRGLADVADLMSREEFAQEKAAAGFLTSLIPTIVRQAALLGDPNVRRSRTVSQNVIRAVPFASRGLPIRRNAFGEPLERSSGLVNTFINPLKPRADRRVDDPVIAEIDRVNAVVGRIRILGKDEESEAAFDLRSEITGTAVANGLRELLASEFYQNGLRQDIVRAAPNAAPSVVEEATKLLQKREIEAMVKRIRTQVTNFRREFPELFDPARRPYIPETDEVPGDVPERSSSVEPKREIEPFAVNQ